ncbi:Phospholipase D delta [Raphanus sativus]|nr:Phospholipase D delta [Raphanus sativus]
MSTTVVNDMHHGMILDDEYVLMRSANINQISLAGTKDTEIAMGAYQPHHTWTNKGRHPRGQLQDHLIKYPLQVDSEAKVSSLPDYDSFPDVGGKIIGVHSMAHPDTLAM